MLTATISGLCRQRFAVKLQFAADGVVIRQRIAAVGGQRLDQVDQDARPLDVAEELVAQADAGVGPFDQAGQVGQDEARVAADRRRCRGWGAWW